MKSFSGFEGVRFAVRERLSSSTASRAVGFRTFNGLHARTSNFLPEVAPTDLFCGGANTQRQGGPLTALTASGVGQTMFGLLLQMRTFKARRSWRAFSCAATLAVALAGLPLLVGVPSYCRVHQLRGLKIIG
jgi:hypothetical protein